MRCLHSVPTTRHAAAVEQLSEEGRPHQEVVAREQEPQGDDEDRRELDEPGERQLHDDDLKAEDERWVGEVEPVGGVGEVAADGALRGAVAHGSAEQGEGPGPDGECVGAGVGPAHSAVFERRRGVEDGRRADRCEAGAAERQREREIRTPLAREEGQETGLAMEQPAEREGRAVGDEWRQLRRETVVGGGNAEPDRPRAGECENGGRRCGEGRDGQPVGERASDPGVDPGAQAPTPVERPDEAGAQREDERVEQAEIVEKPEVDERQAVRCGLRRGAARAGAGERCAEGPRRSPRGSAARGSPSRRRAARRRASRGRQRSRAGRVGGRRGGRRTPR
jgi:hypothetical protein